jgi:hypothetical protein
MPPICDMAPTALKEGALKIFFALKNPDGFSQV